MNRYTNSDTEDTQTREASDNDIEEVRDWKFYIVFLRNDEIAKRHFINRAAAWYSHSDWIHCELYFPNTEESVSIDTKNPVYFMKNKKYFGNRQWTWISISVTPSEYETAYKACKEIEGDPFDTCGLFFFWLPTWCTDVAYSNKWVCSKMCGHVLQRVGVIPYDVNTYLLTPGDLKEEIDRLIRLAKKNNQKHPRLRILSKMPASIVKKAVTHRDDNMFKNDTRSIFYHAEDETQTKPISEIIEDLGIKDLEDDEYIDSIVI